MERDFSTTLLGLPFLMARVGIYDISLVVLRVLRIGAVCWLSIGAVLPLWFSVIGVGCGGCFIGWAGVYSWGSEGCKDVENIKEHKSLIDGVVHGGE